jgi:hypothetical protein
MKNNALLNILNGQQKAFEANVDGGANDLKAPATVKGGKEAALKSNEEFTNALTSEMQKQTTSVEELALAKQKVEGVVEAPLKEAKSENQLTKEVKGELTEELKEALTKTDVKTEAKGQQTAQATQSIMSQPKEQNTTTQLEPVEPANSELKNVLNLKTSNPEVANQAPDKKVSSMFMSNKKLKARAEHNKMAPNAVDIKDVENAKTSIFKSDRVQAQQAQSKNAIKVAGPVAGQQFTNDFVQTMAIKQNLKNNKVGKKNTSNLYAKNIGQSNLLKSNQLKNMKASELSLNTEMLKQDLSGFDNKYSQMPDMNTEVNMSNQTDLASILSSDNSSKLDKAMGLDGRSVLNMNSIAGSEGLNQDELISKISDYIIQTKASNETKVEMSVNHTELGRIDLVVEKAMNDQMNISIAARSMEGQNFFSKNQSALLSTLANAGIAVNDFSLDSGSFKENASGQQEFSKEENGQQGKQNFGSDRGQREHDQQKRAELWDDMLNRDVA